LIVLIACLAIVHPRELARLYLCPAHVFNYNYKVSELWKITATMGIFFNERSFFCKKRSFI